MATSEASFRAVSLGRSTQAARRSAGTSREGGARVQARGWRRRPMATFAIGLACVYLALAFGMALTKRPWCDEAWFATPAWNLVTHGQMGTTNLEVAGTPLVGLDRHTYWIMPLHVLAQAGWYLVFGFSLLSMRALSITWGLVALASLYAVVKSLNGRRPVAMLAVAVMATDFIFVRGAGDGRMDMMTVALGLAGLAAYLHYRAAHLERAIVLGHTLAAAALLTHPYGILAVAGQTVMVIAIDLRRLRWRHLVVAAVPYVLGFGAWGLYILQAPRDFVAQFTGNAAGRWPGVAAFLGTWLQTVWDTYATAFGFKAHWAGAMVHLKALTLAAYVAGVAGVIAVPALRREHGHRVLLWLTAVYFVFLGSLRGTNTHDYLLHIIPWYAALLAISADWCWRSLPRVRWMVAAGVAGLMLLQIGGVAARAALDPYRTTFLPVVEYLRAHAGPQDVVIGGAELGFSLGFDRPLVDDIRVGYYSGKRPDFIVVDDRYREWFEQYPTIAPDVSRYVNDLLANRYVKVYDQTPLAIYRRNAADEPRGTGLARASETRPPGR